MGRRAVLVVEGRARARAKKRALSAEARDSIILLGYTNGNAQLGILIQLDRARDGLPGSPSSTLYSIVFLIDLCGVNLGYVHVAGRSRQYRSWPGGACRCDGISYFPRSLEGTYSAKWELTPNMSRVEVHKSGFSNLQLRYFAVIIPRADSPSLDVVIELVYHGQYRIRRPIKK